MVENKCSFRQAKNTIDSRENPSLFSKIAGKSNKTPNNDDTLQEVKNEIAKLTSTLEEFMSKIIKSLPHLQTPQTVEDWLKNHDTDDKLMVVEDTESDSGKEYSPSEIPPTPNQPYIKDRNCYYTADYSELRNGGNNSPPLSESNRAIRKRLALEEKKKSDTKKKYKKT